MADLSALDRQLLREKWEAKLSEEWLSEGESLSWILLPQQGYAGSAVAGRNLLPHEPLSEVEPSTVDAPAWPLPSEVVSSGAFLDDEWADDPSVLWWAFAANAGQDSVRFADHLATMPGVAFLAASSSRLAVVVEQGKIAERAAAEPEGKGWLGRARSAAAQVQKAAEGIAARKDAKAAVSYFEVPVSRISSTSWAPLGRSIPRSPFLRVDFADGSCLFIRDADAEEHSSGRR
ncbi:hypothetical protein BJ969_003874 [Saccharopolyspora gloriosae]|uniref:Uncharacterized protein n=1 Tax=Saccharopolyspora gloriosae TaxID=455344 RepID=A0A840NEJ0_9PSEU|nr:hypothetical protein [Saccharopolyspora gloriosae]MBB5070786.1 hypothetical protein [Saccharopolyspora gloriosae]